MNIATPPLLSVKDLGLCDYQSTYQEMAAHICSKPSCSLWVLEHYPVYTKGRRSLDSHFKKQSDIPIVAVDRGGQVTYHGPGQMIVYPLICLSRWHISPRNLVDLLEDTTVESLQALGADAYGDKAARGVYIEQKKIASIGIKIKEGYAYHGIAINIDMDLTPFAAIVPCGNPDMQMTQLSDYCHHSSFKSNWLKLFIDKLHTSRYNSMG